MVRLTHDAVMGVIRVTKPVFRDSSDKLAFAVHAAFLASGFALHATGASAAGNVEFDSDSTVEVAPENWNEEEERRYNFLYSYPDLDTIKVLVHMVSDNGYLHIHVSKETRITKLQIGILQHVPVNEDTNYHYRNLEGLVFELKSQIINQYTDYYPKSLSRIKKILHLHCTWQMHDKKMHDLAAAFCRSMKP